MTAEQVYLELLYKSRGIPSDSPLANKWMGDFRKSLEYKDTLSAMESYAQLRLEKLEQENKELRERVKAAEDVMDVMRIPETEEGIELFHEKLEIYNSLR